MNAIPAASPLPEPVPSAAGAAPVRPHLARWAAIAGIAANVWLLATFFLNWTWQKQLGSVAPLGLIWFAGWWRWQRELDAYEIAELRHRLESEAQLAATHAAILRAGRPAEATLGPEDWAFEHRYQERRALERRAAAQALLADIAAHAHAGWRRRLAGRQES